MKAFARAIEAEGDEVVIDTRFQCERGFGRDGRTETFLDRSFNALGGGACMIYFGALVGAHLDPNRHIRAQKLGPWKLARALVELCEVKGTERADAHEHTDGATQHEVGAPDFRPIALDLNAA